MKPESCPKCGVHRECEIWRHCPCGHDFYPGYVEEKRALSESKAPCTSGMAISGKAHIAIVLASVAAIYTGNHFPTMSWLSNIGAGMMMLLFILPFGPAHKNSAGD